MTWDMVAIKDVAYVTTGKTPPKANNAYFGGDIPFITPAELGEEQYIKTAKQTLTQLSTNIIKLVPENSVLVCCIGSLGKLAIANQPVATNQQINAVTFKENVYPKFGYHALAQLKPVLNAIAPATTVAIVNKSKFEELKIPLPPLEEQKRIAAILDKAHNIRQKREQNLNNADALIKSIFLDMFGDPVTNPKGWDVKPLDNLSSLITKGASPKWQGFDYVNDYTQTLFVTSENVREGYLDLQNKKFIQDGFNLKQRRSILKYGDFLINIVGASIGRAAQYLLDQKANINQAVALVRVDDSSINHKYLLTYLNSDKALSMYEAMQVSVARANLSLQNIADLEIVCPPIDLQNKFAEIVTKIEAQKARQNQHLHEADQCFKALQQQFFG